MDNNTVIGTLKFRLREADMPFFVDDDALLALYNSCGKDIDHATYEGALLKSENTSLNVSGLTTAETSDYFKRIASTYRPVNTGVLGL